MSIKTFPRGFAADPFAQFDGWKKMAERSGSPYSDVMILATASQAGFPSARAVLLKGVEAGTFVFFSNYKSRKARELDKNARAAAVFLWAGRSGNSPNHQVRIEGRVEKLSRQESEAYFRTRPRGSQISSWISYQSSPVPSFAFLKEAANELRHVYVGRQIPCPPFWGGYRLMPEVFEFWRAGKNRLNVRVRYLKRRSGWRAQLLSP